MASIFDTVHKSVLLVAALGVTACGGPPRSANAANSATPTERQVASTTPQPASPTAEPTTRLTPQQFAGQRIIYSYPGLTPPESLLQHIRTGEAAGVIFFGENIASTEQIAGVVAQLREANQASPVPAPLLLMTDQEGGRIRRLPGEPTLSEKQIGQSADPEAEATRAGVGAAQTLRGVGMNVNLAPVLDVVSVPGNFIDQFQRSYSRNADTVASLGRRFIAAQQPAGVAATAKHFPGLGATPVGQDTDLQPVTITASLSDLRTRDEAPYPAAIRAGVELIMPSWAVYPALDPNRPAGLSPVVVESELRQRLGYHGVTVTDALEAGALKAFGGFDERAVLAAKAGMDLILCSARDVAEGEGAAAGLVRALEGHELDQAAFRASVDRVTALRNGLH